MPVLCPNKYKPAAAKIAEINNTPEGENLCTTGPAKARPMTIIPVSIVNNNMALSLTFLSSTSIHCPVNNSVMAVPNIQIIIKIKRGFNKLLYMSDEETPLDTRSVSGNSNLEKK